MLFSVFATFVMTAAGLGALEWLLLRQIVCHVQDKPEAVKAILEHVLVPVFGKKVAEPKGPGHAAVRQVDEHNADACDQPIAEVSRDCGVDAALNPLLSEHLIDSRI